MNRYIILIKLVISTGYMFSQNYVDVLKLSGITTPDNVFDSSSVKTKITEINADLTVPIKVNTNTTIITGLIYETIETKLFSDATAKRFGSTTLKIGANKVFNEKWSGTLIALPKIASDYQSWSNKDFQMGAIGIMKFKRRENLNFKFGMYYNTELFGPLFVPIVGIYYQSPNKKFETTIMAPLAADVNYQLLSFMNVGCNFNGQIRSYHLNNSTPLNKSTYVARSTNELFGYLKFNITKSFSVQTKIGHSFGRTYKIYDETDKVTCGLPATFIGNKRRQLNTNFSNGFIYQVTLLYRINL